MGIEPTGGLLSAKEHQLRLPHSERVGNLHRDCCRVNCADNIPFVEPDFAGWVGLYCATGRRGMTVMGVVAFIASGFFTIKDTKSMKIFDARAVLCGRFARFTHACACESENPEGGISPLETVCTKEKELF